MHLKLFVILTTLLISCIIAFYFLSHNPVPTPDHPRAEKMMEGRFATINAFGHHAQYGPHCNGAIISVWWVIAPAHCPDHDYVRVGSHYRDNGTIKYIERRVVNPLFRDPRNVHMFEYDFQLLKLKRNITAKCAHPIPISLVTKAKMPDDAWLVVSGFGEIYENGPLASELGMITIKKMPDWTCAGPVHGLYARQINRHMLCAGFKLGRVEPCKSDLGGPLIYKSALVGLMLSGRGCKLPEEKAIRTEQGTDRKRYSLYGLVSSVMKWIMNVTMGYDVLYLPAPTVIPFYG